MGWWVLLVLEMEMEMEPVQLRTLVVKEVCLSGGVEQWSE